MTSVFNIYARYYDLLYRDKNYEAEANYIASQLRTHGPKTVHVLELGCGTGAHAEYLARMGFTVHGIDLSVEMLAQAELRKTKLPSEISARLTFGRGDARTVRTGKKYDSVISLFHVMSYQTANADLEAAFETAAAHLERGGLFLYDFWNGPAVLTEKPEVRVKRLEDDVISVTRIAEPIMHPEDNIVDVNYTMFVSLKENGVLSQFRESHKMRYLFLPELRLYHKKFEELSSLAWMTSHKLNMTAWAGMQILARI